MATKQPPTLPNLRAGQPLSAHRVGRIMAELRDLAASTEGAATLYAPAADLGDGLTTAAWAQDRGSPAWIAALERAGDRVMRSETGLAAFRVGDAGLAILPPFPLDDTARLSTGIADGPLLALLAAEYTVGVALVRLGRYAIAVYEGQRLAASKTDTRYVKGKHHAGGTSQRRFQRVRENQIHRLYTKASQVLRQQWQPYLNRLDYVVLGGEAGTVNGFVKECDLLHRLAPITQERRLDVREPNRAALDAVGAMLYQCRVYPLRWDG